MSNSNKSHSQFELFPGHSEDNSPNPHRVRPPINDLTLTVENIIVVCICLMMTFVLFFSFGVERGRRLAQKGEVESKASASNKSVDEPFVREEAEKIETIRIDTADLASDTEDAGDDQEIIQVPVERQLSEEQLYTIQVASFKTKNFAQKEAESLGHVGTEIFVLPKGSHNIVCVGKFTERNDAQQFSKKLKTKYRDLLVRRL